MALWLVYTPQSASKNVAIGLEKDRWGWREQVAELSVSFRGTGTTGLQLMSSIAPGDDLLLAAGGPSPRRPPGAFRKATLHGYRCRVTKSLFKASSQLWPDAMYPFRIGIEMIEELDEISASTIGEENLDLFQESALRRGLPIPGVEQVELQDLFIPPLEADETEDPVLALSGGTDAFQPAKVRLEQRKLRKSLFGKKLTSHCAICGRHLPVKHLRVAHIKQRSKCSESERLDMANVMPACTLGCDHLFETGVVFVDASGTVQVRTEELKTPDLSEFVTNLQDRSCPAFGPSNAKYFAWREASPAK
jgi:hypothetical protein